MMSIRGLQKPRKLEGVARHAEEGTEKLQKVLEERLEGMVVQTSVLGLIRFCFRADDHITIWEKVLGDIK